ncbi:hypothetical protein [Wolbachia endosymbiont (group A) of Microdon myrmicae]|uniref:hypothetical protein n=1 Tax=Wolbachia endosymbiont (group A) of Microdon myrmicae TaxID=3139310 RepID=UPI003CCAC523
MGKYTNAWFYKKTDPNHHDCANDGTCGQSIKDFRIGDSDIFFYDSNGTAIAQIPKLPNGNSITYRNNLYKIAQSKNFGENTKYVGLQDVLPNQFNFEYGKLNCVIHYDNVSQREQDQIKLDIQNAYEAYKAKFCMDSDTQVTVHTYVFNNKYDYKGYGTLVPGFSWNQSSLNISGGMTNGESVLLYKNAYTDNVLAHEFGHVFQFKFSPTKVRELDYKNSQLMANAIGLEVEEKNYKAICKQMGVDEYKDRGWMFQFKYKDTTGSIYRKDLSEAEKFQIIQRVKNSGLDEYEDRGSIFSFKYIKNSHESLVSECDGLGNDNTTLVIYIDENKEISRMYFQNSDKNIFKQLDKTFISRSKPEQDVEKSNEVEQSNVEEEKSSQQDTQQPSNFLSNIFSAIKSIIDSISSLFSWLFGSKEKESNQQSDDNPSLFKLDANELDHEVKPDANELGHDVRDHLSDNYNHYNSSDGLM